jgi:hypothetical protein
MGKNRYGKNFLLKSNTETSMKFMRIFSQKSVPGRSNEEISPKELG